MTTLTLPGAPGVTLFACGDAPMRSLLRTRTDHVDREVNEHPTSEPPVSHPTAPRRAAAATPRAASSRRSPRERPM
jgi:hypothetical protein